MSVNKKQQKMIQMTLLALLTLCIFCASMTLLVISATESYANNTESGLENTMSISACDMKNDIINT